MIFARSGIALTLPLGLMLSHVANISAAIGRYPATSLVLQLEGTRQMPQFRRCIERAFQSTYASGGCGSSSSFCEWLEVPGLPTVAEATKQLTLSRIGANLYFAPLRDTRAHQPAVRIIAHDYSADCSFVALVANPFVAADSSFEATVVEAAAAYADLMGDVLDEVCAVERTQYSRAVLLGRSCDGTVNHSESELVAATATAFAVMLALTGRSRVYIDVLAPSTSPRGSSVVTLALHCDLNSGLTLNNLLEVARKILATGESVAAVLGAHAGVIVPDAQVAAHGFQCGPLQISPVPIPGFANWDATVTLLRGERPRIRLDCAFAPDVIVDLLGHILRCTILRPDTKLLDITSTRLAP